MASRLTLVATFFVSIGFIGMAVFGGALMNYSMETGTTCPATVLVGGACPAATAAELTHHLSAVQVFSNITVPSDSVATLLTLLFFASSAILLYGIAFLLPRTSPSLKRLRSHTVPRSQPFLRWLALFEHSPSF